MPYPFLEEEKHKHVTNKLARSVLKKVAKETNLSYHQVIMDFRKGDIEITTAFWCILNEENPKNFNRVDYCSGCNSFTLYHEEEAN
jgi:hypothetical protein